MSLFSRIKYKIDRLWYNLRARYQRSKRGYSYGDVWNMFDWFMRTVKPMLIHLRDHGIGVPLDLYLDGEDNERKAWEDILTEMTSCLELMDEDAAKKYLGVSDSDYSVESYKKARDLMEENKDRFFELFSKYYFDLWD